MVCDLLELDYFMQIELFFIVVFFIRAMAFEGHKFRTIEVDDAV